MCDNCKEKELDISASELKETKLNLDDPIMFFEPLELSTENLAEDINIQFDKSEFIKGLKDSSYFAGLYTGLLNCGFTQEDSVALIFNRMNIENNIEIGKISANATIESSKNVSNAKEKEML